jgi:small conductance mechanosensitive channel
MEQFFSAWGPASPAFWVRAIWAVVAFLVTMWIASLGRKGAQKSLYRAHAHPNAVLLLGRIAQFGIVIAGFIIALAILGVELSALAAFVGLGTVAVTLFLQDVARNLISGIYLLLERPFQIGDTIQVSGEEGVIEDIELRTTIMRNAAGERVIVPNAVIFTNVVTHKNAKAKI